VNGFGLAQDYTKAREWYEKAADKGNTSAMVTLGFLYSDSQGPARLSEHLHQVYDVNFGRRPPTF